MFKQSWRRDLLVGIIVAILISLIFDRMLVISGVPSEFARVSHPANYVELRQNLEFTYEFRTNSQGIRYREVSLDKPKGNRRFVVVGDSFTEGVGVEADQVFTHLLENKLSIPATPTEFINCGLGGAGPLDYARILFHVCMKYNPDVILIVFHANDVINMDPTTTSDRIEIAGLGSSRSGIRKILHALWPHVYTMLKALSYGNSFNFGIPQNDNTITNVSQEARRRGIAEAEIDAWTRRLPPNLVVAADQGRFNGNILAMGLLQPDYWVQSLDIKGVEAEARYKALLSVLDETVLQCQNRGIKVGIVFTPVPLQYDPDYGDIWRQVGVETRSEWVLQQSEFETRLLGWAEAHQLPYLNLTPYYRTAIREFPDLHYAMDGHWTPKGHEIAAFHIAEWLSTWYFN